MKTINRNIAITNTKAKTIFLIAIAAQLFVPMACEDFVNIDPPRTEIVSDAVFESDAAATAAVNGIYSGMMTTQSFTNGGIEIFTGLSSDELTNYSTVQDQIQLYENSLLPTNTFVLSIFWTEAFKYINNANAVLEGLEKSKRLSVNTKRQLEGEAKFIRGFNHFYLVNIFGDVPYITTTDYRVNANASRVSEDEVYSKIIEDILSAQSLLTNEFSNTNTKRVRPIQDAATALLARLYLYTGNWMAAEAEASKLISQTSRYTLPTPDNVFIATSTETIWQLMPVVLGNNTMQARYFIITTTPAPTLGKVALRDEAYDIFEPDDSRSAAWVGSVTTGPTTYYFPAKYKVYSSTAPTEYNVVLRLAEQYLIRAEARAMQNNISGAQEDLNAIRNRAGLDDTDATDQASLLIAIENERRTELFSEWGHRWLDLKRTGKANATLEPIKTNWEATDVLYPVPQTERMLNPNLSQNQGY
jgi:hypothetical protein